MTDTASDDELQRRCDALDRHIADLEARGAPTAAPAPPHDQETGDVLLARLKDGQGRVRDYLARRRGGARPGGDAVSSPASRERPDYDLVDERNAESVMRDLEETTRRALTHWR